ncbi:hypothetical protein HYR54_10405 [Candidatus Acetothermia bacterium]|nr:hypothetical protein [Candidatus Acetothermia bacterium]
MLETVESLLFFGVGPILWVSGLWLFVHSSLSRRRKVIWTIVLIGVGAVIGLVLPFSAIRNKYALMLLVMPVLALVDVRLAKSNRGFFFWFRACAFEICTVFGTAAICRYILDVLKIGALV